MPEDETVLDRRHDTLPLDPDVPVPPGAEQGEASRRAGFLRSHWDVLLVISAGGALGSLARWGVGELLPWSGDQFPWATFIETFAVASPSGC